MITFLYLPGIVANEVTHEPDLLMLRDCFLINIHTDPMD